MRVYLINSRIIPKPGIIYAERISKETMLKILKNAKEIINYCNPRHQYLIDFLIDLFEQEIGRIMPKPEPGIWNGEDVAIVFSPPQPNRSGKELDDVDYEFWRIFYIK